MNGKIKSMRLSIKNRCMEAMLIFISAFVFICQNIVFAEVIGFDESGILCFDDKLNPINNEWRVMDLDFDGKYEEYYFDYTGHLIRNNHVNGAVVNDRGQKVVNNEVYEVTVAPNEINTMEIDNTDFYYISKTKNRYSDNWAMEGDDKVRISIFMPIVDGKDRDIVDKVNDILVNRGLELLKLYAKNEVYKTKTLKCEIKIDKFLKNNIHKYNFLVLDESKFYFNFDAYFTTASKNINERKIGILIDTNNNTCKITNTDYQNINNLTYKEEKEVKTNKDIKTYNSRYIDIVNDIKEECVEAMTEYLNNAEDSINEYESTNNADKKKIITYIERYKRGLNYVYYDYESKAKQYKRSNIIDEETCSLLLKDLEEIYIKYKEVLNNNMNIDINAQKEMIKSENE